MGPAQPEDSIRQLPVRIAANRGSERTPVVEVTAVEQVVERVERQLVRRSVGCDVEVAVSDRHTCSSET